MLQKSNYAYFFKLIVGLCIVTSMTACSSLIRKPAVPKNEEAKVTINGLSDIRYLPMTQVGIEKMAQDLLNTQNDRQKLIANNLIDNKLNFLSISGGGDNGAFGAGLLNGWTKAGNRPSFDLVTGISTGALIAPFAFLGPEYDYVLKKVYTETSPSDIYQANGITSVFFKDALADSSPLFNLISKYVDENFLKKVAHEYQVNKRWLLIGTTNIDAGAPVLWNMGKIASAGTPESLDLFRRILLASASVPGAFPPILFEVMSGQTSYDEMHIDGGASSQVFLYPSAVSNKTAISKYRNSRNAQAYIIRNSRVDSDWMETERHTLKIIARAVSNLIQSQSNGDLYRIYETTRKDNVGFNLAYIGPDFKVEHKQEFDTPYMKELFSYGYQRAAAGYVWDKQPPGFKNALDLDVEQNTALNNKPPKDKTRNARKGVNQKSAQLD